MTDATRDLPPSESLAEAISRFQIELPIDLTAEQIAALERYCRSLWEWNARLNLTRHTTWDLFVARDLVDTLVFARFLEEGENVLDVGTGGGVPGAPLAIVRPDLQVSLCESVAKKAKAVAAIVEESGLTIPVYHARAELLLPDHNFDALLVRAVAPLPKLLTWFEPHWQHFERLLVLKGPKWVEERATAGERGLTRHVAIRKLHSYQSPTTGVESTLLGIWAKGEGSG
ncbi:MAG: 16S rRNA (guanine(527)-N(7))-methyltransferase RsmG [Planctomycetes bacterium]|nr:16S rRNA (guanine(527)-N(7))-methyltransferase RsmG [Planctomycetota bacterium]